MFSIVFPENEQQKLLKNDGWKTIFSFRNGQISFSVV